MFSDFEFELGLFLIQMCVAHDRLIQGRLMKIAQVMLIQTGHQETCTFSIMKWNINLIMNDFRLQDKVGKRRPRSVY